MKNESILYLVAPGYRPAYYELADHLWGRDADIDSDGDSENPGDTEWTELTISLRSGGRDEQVHVDPISEEPLVLKIRSPNAALAKQAAEFLQTRSGGSIAQEWPSA